MEQLIQMQKVMEKQLDSLLQHWRLRQNLNFLKREVHINIASRLVLSRFIFFLCERTKRPSPSSFANEGSESSRKPIGKYCIIILVVIIVNLI